MQHGWNVNVGPANRSSLQNTRNSWNTTEKIKYKKATEDEQKWMGCCYSTEPADGGIQCEIGNIKQEHKRWNGQPHMKTPPWGAGETPSNVWSPLPGCDFISALKSTTAENNYVVDAT